MSKGTRAQEERNGRRTRLLGVLASLLLVTPAAHFQGCDTDAGAPSAALPTTTLAEGERALEATPPSLPAKGGHGFTATLSRVTSTTVELAFTPPQGTSQVLVYAGPEPGKGPGEPLPLERLMAKLPGDARQARVGLLSPGTDVFLRLEARRLTSGPVSVGLHARTLGGPHTPLDTPLREVQLHAPNVVMLVLSNPGTEFDGTTLVGDVGADWQGGTWSVRRHDGRAIAVTAVHRHSMPIGQPDYPVGYNQYGDGDIVDVDHRIFLVLDAPVGSPEFLTLTHRGAAETGLDVTLPFSDRYLETSVIQVNQLGYNPRATARYAYVSGFMGDGGPAPLANLPRAGAMLAASRDPLVPRRTASPELPIGLRAENDPGAGGPVYEIDLAAVPPAEGVRYHVHVPGVGVSYPTAISEEAALRGYYAIWRGIYHNRWCGDLGAQYTDWSRPADHCQAYFVTGRRNDPMRMFASDTPRTDPRPLVGGHHDAGDFDIRPFHVLVGQYLMRAVEMAGARLGDGQLTLPESGNGIPDALDEALWSVAGWEALQNADGSVRFGVESHCHPRGIHFAHQDELPYFTYDPLPWHTAYAAALFAQAAYLVRPYDAPRAQVLEARARRAYAWAEGAGAAPAYRLYAAGELFRLTGEAAFGEAFVARWTELDDWGRGAFDHMTDMIRIYPGAFSGYAPAMADFVMGYVTAPGADPQVRSVTLEQLTRKADAATAAVLESVHAHRNGRPASSSPDWGVGVTTGRHADTIYQRLQLGELDAARAERYLNALSLLADYVLGANPAGLAYVSGLGSRHPEQGLHLDSLSFKQDRGMPPIPGIPVFGPVSAMPGSDYYRPVAAAFYPAFNSLPQGLHVADTRTAVNMNEFTVWESQAPLAELFAALIGENQAPPPSWLPGSPLHRATLPSHTAD